MLRTEPASCLWQIAHKLPAYQDAQPDQQQHAFQADGISKLSNFSCVLRWLTLAECVGNQLPLRPNRQPLDRCGAWSGELETLASSRAAWSGRMTLTSLSSSGGGLSDRTARR